MIIKILKVFLSAVLFFAITISIIIIIQPLTKDQVKTGTEIVFTAGGYLSSIEIKSDSQKIFIEAVSSDSFIIKKNKIDSFTGVSSLSPFGWPDDKYFKIDNKTISCGKWQINNQKNLFIKFTSDQPIELTIKNNSKNSYYVLGSITGSILWLLFTKLIFRFKKHKKIVSPRCGCDQCSLHLIK